MLQQTHIHKEKTGMGNGVGGGASPWIRTESMKMLYNDTFYQKIF